MLGKIEKKNEVAEYTVIGAGPAAICAIVSLLKNGALSKDIIWIDPQFRVGDFGTTLSVGSSVPGNSAVSSYREIYQEIYKTIPECLPKNTVFEIDSLQPDVFCSLKVAAEPFQHITNELRKLLYSIEGTVSDIFTSARGLSLKIQLPTGKLENIITKRAILATGAQPKTLNLPAPHHKITMINPNIAFIRTMLTHYLHKNPDITTVAVVGSSHSAALATMHLLKAGLRVKQFMNKEYKYATPAITSNGTRYTMYDNTGLKGNVAKFTLKLLSEIKLGTSEYQEKFNLYIGKNSEELALLLEEHLLGCSHAVVTVGYEPSNTLKVNNLPLSKLSHNNKTTEFNEVKGLYGIGIGFPSRVVAISGETEFAVGVKKFWSTVNNPMVVNIWKKEPALDNYHSRMINKSLKYNYNAGFFSPDTKQEEQNFVSIQSKL